MAIEQQLNQEEDKDEQQQGVTTGGGAAESSGPSAGPASTGAGRARAPQGSGRFVNLQKYISANQGAGERLGQGIQGQVNRQFGQTANELDKQKAGVSSQLQSGEQTLGRGEQFGQKLTDAGQAEQITQDPNQLQDFTKFRFGQNLDEQSLFDANRGYQQGVVGAQQQAQQRMGQVGSEEGRYGLLQETFGGKGAAKPQYSTGQQRLDQLFLQAGGGDQIRQLQGGIQQQNQALKGREAEAGQLGQSAEQLAAREQALQGMLGTKTTELQSGYQKTLEDQMAAANAGRGAQQAAFADQFEILQGKKQGALTPEFLEAMGLKKGERSFNVLNDQNLTYEQALQNAQNATNFNQTASSQELGRLNALNRLSQGGLDEQGNFSYDQTLDVNGNPIGGAVTNTGLVRDRMNQAGQQYDAMKSKIPQMLKSGTSYSGDYLTGYMNNPSAVTNSALIRQNYGANFADNMGPVLEAMRSLRDEGYSDEAMQKFSTYAQKVRQTNPSDFDRWVPTGTAMLQEFNRLNPTARIQPDLATLTAENGGFTPNLSIPGTRDPSIPTGSTNPFGNRIGIK